MATLVQMSDLKFQDAMQLYYRLNLSAIYEMTSRAEEARELGKWKH